MSQRGYRSVLVKEVTFRRAGFPKAGSWHCALFSGAFPLHKVFPSPATTVTFVVWRRRCLIPWSTAKRTVNTCSDILHYTFVRVYMIKDQDRPWHPFGFGHSVARWTKFLYSAKALGLCVHVQSSVSVCILELYMHISGLYVYIVQGCVYAVSVCVIPGSDRVAAVSHIKEVTLITLAFL